MAVHSFRTNTFARNIYYYGSERLTARDGYGGVPAEYYTPVQQRAAELYTDQQINEALTKGYINQVEFDETMAFKYPAV